MKNLLRYILTLTLAAIAFVSSANVIETAVVENRDYVAIPEVEPYSFESSVPQPDLCIPRQIFGENVLRPQGSTTKPSNAQRSNFEFIKAGKLVNVGIINFTFKKSSNIRYSFTKPAQRLFSLGRLII